MMYLIVTVLAVIMLGTGYFLTGTTGGRTSGAPILGPSASETEIMDDLQDGRLKYTKHARCRMDCRHIDESEIKQILKEGRVNQRKSKPKDQPCPSYAVEGNTKDGQHVRIVYADCGDVTRVITAIDLENHYNCHCD